MKTVLAKRDKTMFYIAPLVVLVSLFASWCSKLLTMPGFGACYIVCATLTIVVAVVALIVLPDEVLIKEGETLVICNGIFNKKTLAWDTILSAETKGKDRKNGDIVLKIKMENGEESISVYQIKEKKTVVETLNNLIIR